MSLRELNTNIFYAINKINTFSRELDLFISQVSKRDLSVFKILTKFWEEN